VASDVDTDGTALHPAPGSHLSSPAELMQCIEALVKDANLRARDQSFFGKFRRSRICAKTLFHSPAFQSTVAVLLIANFCANLIEAEMTEKLINDDGSPSQVQQVLDIADHIFTGLFTAELALNIYAHWFLEFITDGWSVASSFNDISNMLKDLYSAVTLL